MNKLTRYERHSFTNLCQMVKRTVSESSARVYDQTFRKWEAWCKVNGIDPLSLLPANVELFLLDQDVTVKTRQRHLSALRKITQIMAFDDQYRPLHSALSMMKAPKSNAATSDRRKRALSPEEVAKAINVWNGTTTKDVRNRSILSLLFSTGLRRSECADLKWRDIDLTKGVVKVLHGKGDKERDASIFTDTAIQHLIEWRKAQAGVSDYVYSPLANSLKPLPGKISDDTIYGVISETSTLSGIDFTPHDCRRTLITEVLKNGLPIKDTQEQAGHAQASTTLIYAQSVDAATRRNMVDIFDEEED